MKKEDFRMKRLPLLMAALFLLVSAFPVWGFSGFIDLRPGESRSVTTASVSGLPNFFGGADGFYSIFRMSGLNAGQRYEATMTYEAGTDTGYGHSWVDGNPFGKDYLSFIGIGTGTGTRKIDGKQDKFLFTVARGSMRDTMYVVIRSNKPWPVNFSVASPTGVNRESKDRWGYYYVTDFDADKNAPFLLQR